MAYAHSSGYDPFYRPNPHFHPPASFLNFHHYTQSTLSSFASYPTSWCNYCHNPSYHLEQCPSIDYPLGLGENQFNIFQKPMSEPYPSIFHSECWNYYDSAGGQSQQILGDDVQHLSYLDVMSSKLAGEQEKDSFSTHPILDSKPTCSMSI